MQRDLAGRHRPVVVVGLSFCLLFSANAGLCFGDTPDDGELRSRIRVVESALRDLQTGKGAPRAYREYHELQKQLQELQRKHEQENTEPRERIRELWNEEEFQGWHRKITEKFSELSELRQKLQGRIHSRGRELYARRQKELSALAIAHTPEARAMGFSVLDYPRVDGSTSTQPLGMIIACKVLGSPYRWAGTARYAGRWHSEESPIHIHDFSPFLTAAAGHPAWLDSPSFREQFSLVGYRPVADDEGTGGLVGTRRSVIINRMLTVHAGTHGAYVNVIKGASDLGLVARRPSEDELALAHEEGVDLSVEPFALDAFVFIKNHQNPVNDLSTEQIRGIYSGTVKNWSDVGGKNEGINAYRRNRNSGSQELMEKLVMKDRSFEELPHERARRMIHQGMGGPYLALSHDQRGLGYSVYYYEHFMAGSPDTELIAVDGVLPSYETIQSGKYPYVTKVYVVARRRTSDALRGNRLRDWLLSPEGQAVVRESGYVPLREVTAEPNRAQQGH